MGIRPTRAVRRAGTLGTIPILMDDGKRSVPQTHDLEWATPKPADPYFESKDGPLPSLMRRRCRSAMVHRSPAI